MQLVVKSNAEEVAQAAVETLLEIAVKAIDERGLFKWAVSGGSTPRRMLELLSQETELDWSRTHLFQVDERVAPDGSEQRNATMLSQALFTESFLESNKPAGVHLMPVTVEPSDLGVSEYEVAIETFLGVERVFDLVQLGLGADGHTASLVPGDPILDITDASVAMSEKYQGTNRMSLTRPILDKARVLLWVVAGEAKKEAVKLLIDQDVSIPGSLLRPDNAVLVVDEAARS